MKYSHFRAVCIVHMIIILQVIAVLKGSPKVLLICGSTYFYFSKKSGHQEQINIFCL